MSWRSLESVVLGEKMIITRTPLRISYVGGGTDFEDYYKINGGVVISTTINKYIYITVNHKFDDKIHLRYSKVECVDDLNDLDHNIVREGLRMVGLGKGIEIAIISDIPSQGSGLGSSSSLCVGLLKALYMYKGYKISSDSLAQKACELEIKILKAPIGIQDHYAASYGGFNRMTFFPSGCVEVENLYQTANDEKIRWLKSSTMLFYLNGRVSNDILRVHKDSINAKIDVLDGQKMLVKRFMEWINLPPYLLYETSGEQKNDCGIGEIITDSWVCKKQMTPQATSEQIDSIISLALQSGALGAKLCGAGGGGFLMMLCESNKQQNVRDSLQGLLELKFAFESEGAKIIYAE